jgi:Ca-activated chloride channel homolog
MIQRRTFIMGQNTSPASTIKVLPRFEGIKAGTEQSADFLVKIQGPDRPLAQKPRAPLNLALVLDRSGSMAGRPLHEAKRCARTFVSQLHSEDHVCLIAYDNRVTTLFESQPVGTRGALYEAIDAIHPGGTTNLHLGWATGVQALKGNPVKASISRVLLLSDGQANQGMTETGPISHECARAVIEGISTSTYGLSHHFNEDLMTSMAKHGQGQAYYGESAEDLMEPFQQEFDLLSSIYARKVRLKVRSSEGYRAEVLNAYLGTEEKVLPDLAYEAEVWALIRVYLPASLTGVGGCETLNFGDLQLSAVDLDGHALSLPTIPLSLPSLTPADYDALGEQEEVRRRVIEIEAAQIQEKARWAAQEGHWSEVDRLLDEVQALAQENPWLDAVVRTLKGMAAQRDRARFSKESRYSSDRLSTRYSGRDESEDWNDDARDARSFTRRKSSQGKNSDGNSNP